MDIVIALVAALFMIVGLFLISKSPIWGFIIFFVSMVTLFTINNCQTEVCGVSPDFTIGRLGLAIAEFLLGVLILYLVLVAIGATIKKIESPKLSYQDQIKNLRAGETLYFPKANGKFEVVSKSQDGRRIIYHGEVKKRPDQQD